MRAERVITDRPWAHDVDHLDLDRLAAGHPPRDEPALAVLAALRDDVRHNPLPYLGISRDQLAAPAIYDQLCVELGYRPDQPPRHALRTPDWITAYGTGAQHQEDTMTEPDPPAAHPAETEAQLALQTGVVSDMDPVDDPLWPGISAAVGEAPDAFPDGWGETPTERDQAAIDAAEASQ